MHYFLRVCRSDIASFYGGVLVSFVPQVRSVMFYDFELPGALSWRVLLSLRGQTMHAIIYFTWM